MGDLEYNGKIKGVTNIKLVIAEKIYKEAVEFERRNPKVRLNTGNHEGGVLWTREPINDE